MLGKRDEKLATHKNNTCLMKALIDLADETCYTIWEYEFKGPTERYISINCEKGWMQLDSKYMEKCKISHLN